MTGRVAMHEEGMTGRSKNVCLALLASLILFPCVNNYIWLKIDGLPGGKQIPPTN